MDEERIVLNIECYSEKTHDSIGCEIEISSRHSLINEIDAKTIEEQFDECFWEMLYAFENSAQNAWDKKEISGTDSDELFKVFDNFHFTCSIGDEPINIDLGIDPNEYMYSRLNKYLKIMEK